MGSPFLFLVLVASLLMGIVQGQSNCLFTVEQIIFMEENALMDGRINQVREYIICPNRIFRMGRLDINNEIIPETGSPFLPLRPNLQLKCGESGERTNNCRVIGGDVQIDGTSFFGAGDDHDISNVLIEGFTFENANKYSAYGTKSGSITFVDCEWKGHTNTFAPLLFDFFDPASSRRLDVTLIGCDFRDNRYFGDGSYPALITGNGEQNTLYLNRCEFTDNDMVFNNTQFLRNSFLVESSGPVRLVRNCFTDNNVGVSPLAAYTTSVRTEDNYGSSSNGRKCGFVSEFDTQDQFDFFRPDCSTYEATNCLSSTPLSSSDFVPTSAPPGDIPPSLRPQSAATSMSVLFTTALAGVMVLQLLL